MVTQLLDPEIVREWSPLDSVPAPEYVPPYWTGPHVGKRLLKGLRVLALMPAPKGPWQFGNAWPAWSYDWADLLAQQEAEEEEKQRNERVQNRARVRPSSVQIAHMEAAISWPMVYLIGFPQLVRTVTLVAFFRSRDQDADRAARKLGLPRRLCRKWNRQGLDEIAAGLRRDRVPVF